MLKICKNRIKIYDAMKIHLRSILMLIRVDFKQANRPKKKEWIEDYYLQIAAYAMAHDYVHESAIQKGVIMICTPDLYYQEYVIEGPELRQYKHKFLKRLDMYHDIKFDEKEQAQVSITSADFTRDE